MLPAGHFLERLATDGAVLEIEDEREVRLTAGDHFIAREPGHHAVLVLINRKPYLFEAPHQTGHSLKQRAGIPASDVLFLNRPKEDEVIPDDLRVKLRTGERFHSAPPANYGDADVQELDTGYDQSELLAQPDGWVWLRIAEYPLNRSSSASTRV